MKIETILEGANTYANSILGNAQTKQKVQEGILRLIVLSCQQYQKDESFKSQIDNLERTLRP